MVKRCTCTCALRSCHAVITGSIPVVGNSFVRAFRVFFCLVFLWTSWCLCSPRFFLLGQPGRSHPRAAANPHKEARCQSPAQERILIYPFCYLTGTDYICMVLTHSSPFCNFQLGEGEGKTIFDKHKIKVWGDLITTIYSSCIPMYFVI